MKKVLLTLVCIMTLSINAQTFTNYTANEIGFEGFLSDLIVDNENNYWVTSWDTQVMPGIASYDGVTWQTYGVDEGTSGFAYRGLFQSSNGLLYFGSFLDDLTTGFEVFDGTSWTLYNAANGFLDTDVSSFAEAANGDIWICHLNGVSKFDGISFVNYVEDNGVFFGGVAIFVASDGLVWMSTSEGVSTFDGTTFTNYTMDDGLVTDNVFAIHEDMDGYIWVGGFEFDAGVNRFDGMTFTTFNEITDATRKIISASDGTLYFGGETAGISVYDGVEFTFINEDDGLLDNHIRGIDEDGDGNIIISTWLGVSVYNPTLGTIDNLVPDFKIHPNPATAVVSIESGTFQTKEITVFNLLGNVTTTLQLQSNENQFSIENLSAGVYLLKFSNAEGERIIKKIIKQ